ncbi:CTP synthase [Nanoarchaeota archaeon]
MTKYIVVVGGVISGVGKGVTTASIGRVLKERGFSVTAVKIDPYINYDAGTLRPTEHGEVWVTNDGGEIDQDLGNYERFLGEDIPKRNNITTGQVYKAVIDRERAGKYLGKTVQFIPHIPEEIKNRVKAASKNKDFVLIEIGGTIGDFENVPFLFAMKSLERELGGDVIYVLVTYLPVPSHIEEMKTKPTQQAIRMLSENGIFPDLIICRSKRRLDDVRKKKIETYANIRSDHVISEPDIDTIYRIPLDLEKDKIGDKVLKLFRMKSRKKPKWKEWSKVVNNIVNPKRKIKIAMIGKYVDIGDFSLTDSYISINHSLQIAGAALNTKVEIGWIDAKKLEKGDYLKKLSNYDGVLVPGGFGSSGVEGKIKAAGYARKHNIPYLGLCYGMQLAIVEFARNVCGMEGANTAEVNPKTKYPVIDILPMQKELIAKSRYGGTMRLGAYAAMLKKNSRVLKLYKDTNRIKEDKERIKKFKRDKQQHFRLGVLKAGDVVLERHRHRYEVNPEFVSQIEEKGMVFSGYHERTDGTKLMEFIELPKHKFYFATQGHPEFKSRFGDPAPLFLGFVKACLR